MLQDLMTLLDRAVVALERLADAQTLIATEDGPVRVSPPAAAVKEAPAQAAADDGRPAAPVAEEVPAQKTKPATPEDIREALAAVTQTAGKAKAAEILATFKGQDGKPVRKVSSIPADALDAVLAELKKAVV